MVSWHHRRIIRQNGIGRTGSQKSWHCLKNTLGAPTLTPLENMTEMQNMSRNTDTKIHIIVTEAVMQSKENPPIGMVTAGTNLEEWEDLSWQGLDWSAIHVEQNIPDTLGVTIPQKSEKKKESKFASIQSIGDVGGEPMLK